MGVMDKFLSYMKLNGDEEYDDYDDDDYYDDDEPVEKISKITPKAKAEPFMEEDKPKKASPKVTPMRQPRRTAGNGMEVCVIKPTSIEDAREITETLLANRTVVLNLEGLDVDVAQRIIDFTSGSCFAISGKDVYKRQGLPCLWTAIWILDSCLKRWPANLRNQKNFSLMPLWRFLLRAGSCPLRKRTA